MSTSSALRKAYGGALSYAVASILACSVSAHADAQAMSLSRTVTVKISPQKVSTALLELSQQAGVQVLMPAEVGDQQSTQGVNGEMSLEQALQKLLEGTSLRFKAAGENVIGVESAMAAKKRAAVMGTSWMRLAAAETEQSRDSGRDDGAANESARGQAGRTELEEHAMQVQGLEEVIVTAQKREERLIDVPVSIVALGGGELRERNVTGIDDLAMAVPGLAVQSAGAWSRRITMRGISNVFGTSSLIGVYLDEASATSGPDLQLDMQVHDLERVEVLRGPQGTLYGEGSAGGTVRFITKDPRLDAFTMKADLSALFTQDGSPGERIEGVLDIPVVQDVLGFRVAGVYAHQGGWIDQPVADRDDINEQELYNVRVKGLWQPTESFTVNAMALVHRNDGSTNTGEDDNGNYTQVFNLTSQPRVEDDYDIYNLTLTYDMGPVQVLNTATYIDQYKEQRDYGYRLPLGPPPTVPLDVLKPLYWRDAQAFTDELRLSSTGVSAWQWTIGGYYRRFSLENYNTFYAAVPGPPGTPLPTLVIAPNEMLSEASAVFGDLSYRLTDRLTLGAGGRYYEDEQEFTTATFQTGKFNAFSPRVYVRYKIADDVTTYASAAKGFRSGGFNALNQPKYDPESVWTYELGAKMSVLENRLRADVAVFQSDYDDYQINGFLPPPAPQINIFSNAGNARVRGVEWALAWSPLAHWTLELNGEYVDSEFVKITSSAASYAVGDPVDLFPDYRYTVSSQHDFVLGGKEVFLRVDYNEQGRMTFRNRRSGPWYFGESDVINMLNVNAEVRWSRNLSLGLFAQNLLDDRGYADPFGIEWTGSRSRPRAFGVRIGFEFD